MKKKDINGLIFLGVILLFLLFFYSNKKDEVCFENYCIDVEIMDSTSERSQGLMFREYLSANSGMLFIFDSEEIYPFWMKNTLISLDIIWIDSNMKVVDFTTMAPCVVENCEIYTPSAKSKYALEVNAGFVSEKNIHIGQIVQLK